MNIFVTGGTGFIGQHLIRALLVEGNEVHFLIRDQNKAGIFGSEKAIPQVGSLENTDSYRKVFNQNIEVVYHLAAIPGQKWGFRKKDYYKLNVQATKNLLEVCQNKIKRFIFCSSINAISENGFLRDDYGQSKWQAERYVQEYQQRGLKTVIIRPAVIYGPGDIQGMMLKLCRLVKSRKFRFISSGNNVLPFVYISDLVSAFLQTKDISQTGGAYEIIGPDLPTFRESVNQIASILKVELPKTTIPIWLARPAAFFSESISWLSNNEPLITQHRIDIITKHKPLDYQKAKADLSYNPKTNFKEGISETINWYQKHGYI
ncbi:MAG: hypothetical protein COT24_02370 [Candidatus Kerfeldbacteria bacterium CG08_land_8_20_14_0_20_40_16]|uniref:NAD-dependent epimerase/dehydratase domain-containing protein n=1 Tax=Candidatus Kerfeldbacteria bacterium CG08_land_8_20_14_0_20_40_16 TaxID=2014244 RepID=A0A2H0YVW2_9BACT|nr:MAG: hypothetical protein COT24_02370 [Candidatus Kerfeldbacteria bacterium CG08_land_8_20_14_0_20_40_16]